MTKNYWEPFNVARKKITTRKDQACYFSGTKIFKGKEVEAHEINVNDGAKRSKQMVYMCGVCDNCKHLAEVRNHG